MPSPKSLTALALLAAAGPAGGQTPVLTRSYDVARTGANTAEKVLTPDRVAAGLKLAHKLPLDDDPRLEAQPLYVPGLVMADGHKHDVLFLATMANNLWAYDLNTGGLLWKRSVAPPGRRPVRPVPKAQGNPGETDIDMWGTNKLWGVLSTPVIDLETSTLYVVTWSSGSGDRVEAEHHLSAIDLTTGARRRSTPILAASADSDPPATFKSPVQKQRAALLLLPGGSGGRKTVVVASGQIGEKNPGRHGWVLAFDASTLSPTAAWCSSPGSFGAGIWQAAQGPAADDRGNVYVMTSNGGWDEPAAGRPKTDYAESFVRLAYTPPMVGTNGRLAVADWFTPFRDAVRRRGEFQDNDLGSGGVVVTHGTGFVLGAGKDGILYVFDRANLGGKLARTPADFDHLKQTPPVFFTHFPTDVADSRDITAVVPDLAVPGGTMLKNLDRNFGGKTRHQHGSPIYWAAADKARLYNWGENENLRAWELTAAGKTLFLAKGQEVASRALALSPTGEGGMPGGMLTLSADGGDPSTGIVWALAPVDGDANRQADGAGVLGRPVEGVLRAYHATKADGTNADGTPRLALIWDSKRLPGHTFTHAKFNLPVVADGRVVVPTADGRVDVYTLP